MYSAHVGASGDIDTSDLKTGDASTDAQIDSGVAKLATGKTPTVAESGALMAGACEALGVLVAGTAGTGAIFAAALAAEWAVMAGLYAVMKALGWNASAGPGWCATNAPTDASDPRWRHFESSGVDFNPSNGFEIFARPYLKAFWEAQNNCKQLPPGLTATKLLYMLSTIYNRTHAGPAVSYRPLSDLNVGWGGEAPWFTAAPATAPLLVNMGAPLGPPPRYVGGLHSAITGLSGTLTHALAVSTIPVRAIGNAETAQEVQNARDALQALASWLVYYGVKR